MLLRICKERWMTKEQARMSSWGYFKVSKINNLLKEQIS